MRTEEPARSRRSSTPEAVHRKRGTCRACNASDLRAFLSLGTLPLANGFLRSPDDFGDEARYPLDVYFCPSCSLVQLRDVVAAEALFADYIYVTGTSTTMRSHNAKYVSSLVERFGLGRSRFVVEIASNDGSLLAQFRSHGVRMLGVEPAANLARLAELRGVPTENAFFDSVVARRLRSAHGPADVVIGNNVLAHVDATIDFLSGCRELLAPGGHVVIEVPYLGDLLERCEYDTIYHEHLCYFSVTTLMRVFARAGLSLVDYERSGVHGGSIRVYAVPRERQTEHGEPILALSRLEKGNGLTSLDRYDAFAAEVQANRTALRDCLTGLRRQGHTVAAYGAPAKGNTLLNYCGLDAELVRFTVDQNPMKVGLYTPGTHIPIKPVTALLDERPAYALLLAWNFADEILAQQAEFRRRGGRFIVPIPSPTIA